MFPRQSDLKPVLFLCVTTFPSSAPINGIKRGEKNLSLQLSYITESQYFWSGSSFVTNSFGNSAPWRPMESTHIEIVSCHMCCWGWKGRGGCVCVTVRVCSTQASRPCLKSPQGQGASLCPQGVSIVILIQSVQLKPGEHKALKWLKAGHR